MFSVLRTLLFAVVAACLIASTLATAVPAVHIAPGHRSCYARERGYLVVNYDVRVGRTWTKEKCAETYRNLQRVSAVSAYKCQRLSGGHMHVKFNNLRGSAYEINSALNKSFPIIARTYGWFNCPDH